MSPFFAPPSVSYFLPPRFCRPPLSKLALGCTKGRPFPTILEVLLLKTKGKVIHSLLEIKIPNNIIKRPLSGLMPALPRLAGEKGLDWTAPLLFPARGGGGP